MENIPEFSVRCTLNGQTPGIAKPGVINAGKFSQLPLGAAVGVLLLTSWELHPLWDRRPSPLKLPVFSDSQAT
jgi:hypothetical protein